MTSFEISTVIGVFLFVHTNVLSPHFDGFGGTRPLAGRGADTTGMHRTTP